MDGAGAAFLALTGRLLGRDPNGDEVDEVTARMQRLSTAPESQEGSYKAQLESIKKVTDPKKALRRFMAFTKECFGKIDPFEVIASFKRKFTKNPSINQFILKVANAFFEAKELDQAKRAILEVGYGSELQERDTFLVRLSEAFYAEKRYEDALRCISAIKNSDVSKQQFVRFSKLHLGDLDPLQVVCAFHELYCKSADLNPFILELARSYLQTNQVRAARVAITQLGCDNAETDAVKDQFLVTLSETCYNEQNYEEGLLAISLIRDGALCQAQFLAFTGRGFGYFDPLKVIEIFQKRDPNGLFLNKFIFNSAYAYFIAANVLAARTVISKVVSGTAEELIERDRLLVRLFETSYEQGNYKEACACISAIRDANTRQALFVDFSERNLGNFNPITLVDAFLQSHRASSLLNPFVNKVVQGYMQAGDLDAAKEAILRFGCGTADDLLLRDTVLRDIAVIWYERDEYEKAMEAISIIRPWNALRHDFVCMLSRKYLQDKNWPRALTIIRTIDDSVKSNSLAREELLVQLATACIDGANWGIAESAIEQIVHDEKRKVSLTYSLVESCLQSGDHRQAFAIITRFKMPETPEYQITNSLTFFRVVCAYFKTNDEDADSCAMRYIAAVMGKEFSINGITRKYSNGVAQIIRIGKFSAFLYQNNSEFFHNCFIFEDWMESIEKIEQLVRVQASFEAFEKYFDLEGTQEPKANREENRKNKVDGDGLYVILELPPTATIEEVKRQYKKLVLKYHPDKLFQAEDETDKEFETRKKEAIVKFTAITTAYQYLAN